MANFIADNIKKTVFIDVNFLDILGENTFEFNLYTLLRDILNLFEFTDKYKKKVRKKDLFTGTFYLLLEECEERILSI